MASEIMRQVLEAERACDARIEEAQKKAAETLDTFGVTEKRLILNRFHAAAVQNNFLVNIDDAIDRTGVQLIGVIPEDPEIAFRMPQGQLPGKKSAARAALERITRRIEGENVPLRLR